MATKCDMSAVCGMHYDQYWSDTHVKHTMSEDYFLCWFDRNCAQCTYMSDVCMHGEETHMHDDTGDSDAEEDD